MIIYYWVYLLNILIGLLIPFRQYKNGLFLFFLLAGIADPIIGPLNILFGTDTNLLLYCYQIFLFIITIHYIKKERISRFYLISVAIFVCLIPLLSFGVLIKPLTQDGISLVLGLSTIIIILITYNLLILMSRNIFTSGKVNLYFLAVVFSSLLTTLKLGVLAIKLQVGVAYFVISFFLEGIINIYFIFFDIKNSPQISLGGKKAKAEVIES